MNFLHYPVMNKEVLEIFQGSAKKLFVDCTVGGGGHSYHILDAFPAARVIAIDQDEESIALARENLRFSDGGSVFIWAPSSTFLRISIAGSWLSPESWSIREFPRCS